MDAILLKNKQESESALSTDLVVFDEIITGILTKELFLSVFTGCDKGLHIMPLSYLIDNYKFPEKEGKPQARFLHFLRGYNPELLEIIEWYEDDTIEFKPV